MEIRNSSFGLAALGLTVFGLIAVPVGARAQGDGADPAANSSGLSTKKIDLDLESANLYSGLKLLFDHIKANFTLDPSLKQAEVTVHLHDVAFNIALETLLKSSGLPLTYKFENNIYSIVPKVDETVAPGLEPVTGPDTGAEPEGKHRLPIKIRSNQLTFNAVDIVTALGGKVINVGTGGFGSGGMTGGMGGMGGGMGGMGGMMGGMGGMGGMMGGMGGMGGMMGGMGGMGGMMGGMGGMGGGGMGGGMGGFGGGGMGGRY